MLRYEQRPPCTALAPFVAHFWLFEGTFDHGRERIVPDGRMQVLVNLADDELRSYHGAGLRRIQRTTGASLNGAFGHGFGIDTAEQRRIVGASFHPGGAAPFFREPADAMRDLHVGLDALWGRDGEVARERLLEARSPGAVLATMERMLLERVHHPLVRDRGVDAAMRALEAGGAVPEVAKRVGLSRRSLERHFRARVGLSPKRYGMLRRFRGVIAEAAAGPPAHGWADLAVRHGYCDQSHLVRDFQRFAGVTPSAYRPRHEGDLNHIAIVD